MCSQYHTFSGPLLEDWDIISPKDVISTDLLLVEKRSLAAAALPFTQSIISQVGLQGVELLAYIFIGWYLQDLIMQMGWPAFLWVSFNIALLYSCESTVFICTRCWLFSLKILAAWNLDIYQPALNNQRKAAQGPHLLGRCSARRPDNSILCSTLCPME